MASQAGPPRAVTPDAADPSRDIERPATAIAASDSHRRNAPPRRRPVTQPRSRDRRARRTLIARRASFGAAIGRDYSSCASLVTGAGALTGAGARRLRFEGPEGARAGLLAARALQRTASSARSSATRHERRPARRAAGRRRLPLLLHRRRRSRSGTKGSAASGGWRSAAPWRARCASRSTTSWRCRARSCASSTSASRAGPPSRSARACPQRAGAPRGPRARRAATSTSNPSTTTITRAGTSRARSHPQTLIVYGQDGAPLDPALRRAGARLLAGQARLQEHQVPDAHPLPARDRTAATGATRATSGTGGPERRARYDTATRDEGGREKLRRGNGRGRLTTGQCYRPLCLDVCRGAGHVPLSERHYGGLARSRSSAG